MREVGGQARGWNLNFHVLGSWDQSPHSRQAAPSPTAGLRGGVPHKLGLDLGLIWTLTLGVEEPRQVQQCRGCLEAAERGGLEGMLGKGSEATAGTGGQCVWEPKAALHSAPLYGGGAHAALCPPLQQGRRLLAADHGLCSQPQLQKDRAQEGQG